MNELENSCSKPTFQQLQDALEKSTVRNSRQLLSFVLIQLYLLITVAATTDLQLLLPDSKVTLPLLNVELPLFGFYVVAPSLIVIFHFHYMINLLQHARKLKAWDEATTVQQKVLLPGFVFNFSILFKNIAVNYKWLRFLQAAILCYFPLLLLLFIQIRFADYHSQPMTSWHFGLVFLDFHILIVYWFRINYLKLVNEKYGIMTYVLGPRKRSKKEKSEAKKLDRPTNVVGRGYLYTFVLALFASIICSFVVAAVNNNVFERRHFFIPYISTPGATLVNPPSDLIINAYLIQGNSLDSAWFEHGQGIDLSGRDLQFANLSRTDLRYADLSAANLNGANLDNAKINFADLSGVQLNGASLSEAELNGADLNDAQLNGADLNDAQLNGASLDNAQLNGASLDNAQLNGADLYRAQLNGASLFRAELNGVSLIDAQLNGAELGGAQLNGASLGNARLKGAVVSQAQVIFDDSYGVEVRGASSFEFSHRNGLFFDIPPDTITIPDWDRLITALEGFISIPSLKENALERLRDAKLNSSYLNPEFRELKPDIAGFIEIRQELSCQSIYIAKGLLLQFYGNFDLNAKVSENILQHMAQNCPDTLAAAQTFLPVY